MAAIFLSISISGALSIKKALWLSVEGLCKIPYGVVISSLVLRLSEQKERLWLVNAQRLRAWRTLIFTFIMLQKQAGALEFIYLFELYAG